jgi:hypothetical protein
MKMIKLRLDLPYDHRHTGDFEIVGLKNGTEIGSFRVSLDCDYPKIAEIFGCHAICDCGSTDGSVDCDHKTASQMIGEAFSFLDDNIGAISDETFGYEVILQD